MLVLGPPNTAQHRGQREPHRLRRSVEPLPQKLHGLLVQRAVLNTAGCAMARIDGKSPVDYLSRESQKEAVRQLCRALFAQTPANWSDVLERTRHSIHQSMI